MALIIAVANRPAVKIFIKAGRFPDNNHLMKINTSGEAIPSAKQWMMFVFFLAAILCTKPSPIPNNAPVNRSVTQLLQRAAK